MSSSSLVVMRRSIHQFPPQSYCWTLRPASALFHQQHSIIRQSSTSNAATTSRNFLLRRHKHFHYRFYHATSLQAVDKVRHLQTLMDQQNNIDTNNNHHHQNPLEAKSSPMRYTIPQTVKSKLTSAEDAVALIRDNDTVCVSGFVAQGAAEAVLKALGDRFETTGSPKALTALFGGGPGDYDKRGVGHLGRVREEDGSFMLKRSIGGHYGQVPQVAQLALNEQIEAWTLPMGSISRMIRAQSTHSPGHITRVGIGTYVDPDQNGGAANELAKQSEWHKKLVTKLEIDGTTNLMYKALPIDVGIIRGTTADAQGNISLEHESLLCDQKIVAAATKNSGGIVICQVKRVAANGSIPSRTVAIPGALVDCVVVVDDEDHDEMHGMSFLERHNPNFAGELKSPQDAIARMPLDIRKLIARRASFKLQPNTIVNLGIGLPEGVASVASEEGILEYLTLTTEPGVFGGLPASGHSFGPAYNAEALVEMNSMFDLYDGGLLDICFLGAAQISSNGNVNVSRMSKDRLTGPGGFIDIITETPNICFMTTFTAKGLKVEADNGNLKINKEGGVKKFVNNVFEITFSGDEAVKRGQNVLYVTERAVFRRTNKHGTIELIEVAPGVDLQKDILDQMDFTPMISNELKVMDPRIFREAKMEVTGDIFGSLEDRAKYDEVAHAMYVDLFGVILNKPEDVDDFCAALVDLIQPYYDQKGKLDMVFNYEGFDLAQGLEEKYSELIMKIQEKYYSSIKRYTGRAFTRAKLSSSLGMDVWDPNDLFNSYDHNKDGLLSLEKLRTLFLAEFNVHLTPSQLLIFQRNPEDTKVDREMFEKGMAEIVKSYD